jgi:hypothetical protein
MDINGPKGGPDKALRIAVVLSGCEKVVLTGYGSDFQLLVDKAAGRAKMRVSSMIEKARRFDPQRTIRREFVQ